MRNMLLSFIALCIAIPCLADDCIIVTTLSDVLECEDCYEQGGIVYFNFSDKHYGMSKEDILSIEYVTPNEPEFAEKPYSENSQLNKV